MREIPVISVVAYSGTGKTTLIEKVIKELKKRGYRVAVVKHDAHKFEIDREGKDSWRHAQAGAEVVAIVSNEKSAVMEYRQVELTQIIAQIRNVDIIITEGYKTGSFPKIAIRRMSGEHDFAVPPEDCVALVSDVPFEIENIPVFYIDDALGLTDFIVEKYL